LTILADTLALQVDELTAQIEMLQTEKIAAEAHAHEAETGLKVPQQILKELGLKPKKPEIEKSQTTSEA
jgi:hypothetical protein